MITPAPLGLFTLVVFALVAALIWLLVRAFPADRIAVVSALSVWIAVTGALPLAIAAAGLPTSVQFPAFLATLAIVLVLAVTAIGVRTAQANGLALLAGAQVFRLPLEIVLIQWHEAGFMPVQMTWRGDNLDIVTGILALPAALLIAGNVRPRTVAFAFNLFGLLMVFRIIWIVALSSPTPLRALVGGYTTGPEVLVGLFFPSVWIATLGVGGAIFLHVASIAHLLRTSQLGGAPARN